MPSARDSRVRQWDRVAVHAFTRPAGESIVRVPYMRLLVGRSPRPGKLIIRLNGGAPQVLDCSGTSVSLIPRDATAQVTTDERNIIHIFQDPETYRRAAEEIGKDVSTDLDFVFDMRDAKIAELAAMLAHEGKRPGYGDRMLVEGLNCALAVRVLRCITGVEPSSVGGLSPERLRRVTDYIEANLADSDLSLRDMAATVCLSVDQFSRAFKHSTGSTPHQYVLRRRVECAKSLLREGNMPLSAIACATGFADQAHFSHRFRQQTATTPRQYRLASS
jgi:AraC family transcriptional regulator